MNQCQYPHHHNDEEEADNNDGDIDNTVDQRVFQLAHIITVHLANQQLVIRHLVNTVVGIPIPTDLLHDTMMNLIPCCIAGIDIQNVLCNGFPFCTFQIHIRGILSCQRDMRCTIQRPVYPHHKNINTGCRIDQLPLLITGIVAYCPALQRGIQCTVHLFTNHRRNIAVDIDKEKHRKKCHKEKDQCKQLLCQ